MTQSQIILLLCNLLLGYAAGFIMHRSDFCIAGMFRDLFLFRSTTMLKNLALLILSSMVLFELARRSGLLFIFPFPLLGNASAVNLAGGLLFGVGMVLAGGCVVGTLYKVGGGSATSSMALFGLLCGSYLYSEIHPWWSELARQTTFLPGRVTLPQALEMDPGIFVLVFAVAGGLWLLGENRRAGLVRPAMIDNYLQPWKAALLLSVIGLLSFAVVGMPLGITTAYAKLGAYMVNALHPEHVARLSYFAGQPLDYSIPYLHLVVKGGAGPQVDGIALVQFPLIGGIILGAFSSAVLAKEFHIHIHVPFRQYASALCGGLIMGLAARMAPACNVWHLLGGMPVLGLQSMLFLIGLFPGAWLGTTILTRTVLTH